MTIGEKETTESFGITSPFGVWLDPIIGKWAWNQGVVFPEKEVVPYSLLQRARFARQFNLGNLLKMEHGNGYVSSYRHLDSFAVKVGD